MFVTCSRFQDSAPADAADPDKKFWLAVALPGASPWYVFVHKVGAAPQQTEQSFLVACERTLLELLESTPRSDHLALFRLQQSCCSGYGWITRWIRSVWRPATVAEGELVIEFEVDRQPRDSRTLRPVHSGLGPLVFKCSTS